MHARTQVYGNESINRSRERRAGHIHYRLRHFHSAAESIDPIKITVASRSVLTCNSLICIVAGSAVLGTSTALRLPSCTGALHPAPYGQHSPSLLPTSSVVLMFTDPSSTVPLCWCELRRDAVPARDVHPEPRGGAGAGLPSWRLGRCATDNAACSPCLAPVMPCSRPTCPLGCQEDVAYMQLLMQTRFLLSACRALLQQGVGDRFWVLPVGSHDGGLCQHAQRGDRRHVLGRQWLRPVPGKPPPHGCCLWLPAIQSLVC